MFQQKLSSQGYIYKGSYAGWYSVSDEAYLAEEDLTEKLQPGGDKLLVCENIRC